MTALCGSALLLAVVGGWGLILAAADLCERLTRP